jgi:hypothetical protein
MAETAILERTVVVRHERRLEYFTVAWNAIERLVAVAMDVIAGSISLVGFGFDRKRPREFLPIPMLLSIGQ